MAKQIMMLDNDGPVYLGDFNLTTRLISNQVRVGCVVSKLTLELERTQQKIYESCSGKRGLHKQYSTTTGGKVTLDLQEYDVETYAIAMGSVASPVTGATVSAEVLPTLADDDVYHLAYTGISNLVLTDSAPTPVTVDTEDYVIESTAFGRIRMVDVATYVQPLKAAYTHAAATMVKPLTIDNVVKALIYTGKSAADGTQQRVILPRVNWSTAKSVPLAEGKLSTLTVPGELMVADVDADDPVLGPFGSIVILPGV